MIDNGQEAEKAADSTQRTLTDYDADAIPDCTCDRLAIAELECWSCFRERTDEDGQDEQEQVEGAQVAADGSGARAVDPDRPEIESYSDDNHDDNFGAGGNL